MSLGKALNVVVVLEQTNVEVHGDEDYILPMMHVVNIYETLVIHADSRIHSSFSNMCRDSIGFPLESTGGLFKEFLKRFPKDGAYKFRRRELIGSYRGMLKFPELFEHHTRNRERFNVTRGLEITEKAIVKCKDDALWFWRLTGRSDVVVYPTDYKFYSPRRKGKRYRMSNGSYYFQSVKNYPISGSILIKNVSEASHLQDRPVSVNEGQIDAIRTRVSRFCNRCGYPYVSPSLKFCGQCGAKREEI
nr:hypothetical protein [Tanacetum cinerariifolium]